jgi:protein-L-isoaspartate O-methyltransferase
MINREAWTAANAAYTNRSARSAWAREEITRGLRNSPDAELGTIPEIDGEDVIECGSGAGYFGARLNCRGAWRVLGVEITRPSSKRAGGAETMKDVGNRL